MDPKKQAIEKIDDQNKNGDKWQLLDRFATQAKQHEDPNVWQLLDRLVTLAEQQEAKHEDPNVWQVMAPLVEYGSGQERPRFWKLLDLLNLEKGWEPLSRLLKLGCEERVPEGFEGSAPPEDLEPRNGVSGPNGSGGDAGSTAPIL